MVSCVWGKWVPEPASPGVGAGVKWNLSELTGEVRPAVARARNQARILRAGAKRTHAGARDTREKGRRTARNETEG